MEGMAASATLHCLTGCATGEIVALVVATAVGLGALSSLPLLRSGLAVGVALKTVVLADTISILTMEVVDNAVVLLILAPCTRGWSTPPSGGGWAWPSWLPTPRPTRSTG
jgi:hypothetical protein